MGISAIEVGTVQANGTTLHYESRGEGSAILLIAGGLADAGQFGEFSDVLGRDHRVITYDRRGNSRSPAPEGWTTTTVEQQSDDAAALLVALGVSRPLVYGHSIGAPIALDLGLRHPATVQGVALHDPAMMGTLADPGAVMAVLGPVIGEAMTAGGPPAAADAFYRFAVGPAIDALDPAVYERMKADGGVLFGVEFESLSGWLPDEGALRENRVPVRLLVGAESPPFFREAAEWLSARLDAKIADVPGGHGAAFVHPNEVAQRLEDFIGEVGR
ncbi:MAG TPA: alpha/beta hydrolase [Actinomycetota bacterium]|nr:alpha/beta hydrolase [Actinomycetota bacterium]